MTNAPGTAKTVLVILMIISFLSPAGTLPGAAAAEAGDPPAEAGQVQPDEGYWTLSGRKLGRGVQNTALGWLELPAGIQEVGAKHGVGAAATWGILHGLGRAIQRTAVGVFEVVTFPLGVPQDFEPIIEPDIGQTTQKPDAT